MPTRWVGTNTFSATAVLLAVPCIPATNQVSLIVTCSTGTVAIPGATGLSAGSRTMTPPPAQLPWKLPDDHCQVPFTM